MTEKMLHGLLQFEIPFFDLHPALSFLIHFIHDINKGSGPFINNSAVRCFWGRVFMKQIFDRDTDDIGDSLDESEARLFNPFFKSVKIIIRDTKQPC